jgi:hypothetical protein
VCDPDFDMCNGGYKCQEGKCVESAPVTCDTPDNGCIKTVCNSGSGECEPFSDNDACADEDFCTQDVCGEDGQCTNPAIEGCGMNDPCKPADVPGSSDQAVTECLCAEDSYCCTNKWDSLCVSKAKDLCGLSCDCNNYPAEDLACESNSDCSWCGDTNLCNDGWSCVEGKCAQHSAVMCDEGASMGCMINTCNSSDGTCGLTSDVTKCEDDGDDCTETQCNEDGSCTNEPIPNCNSTTCEDRCGDYSDGASCQCDDECIQYGDCCDDLCDFCAESYPEQCTM